MSSHIALGGGCHWCTEAVFQALKGVSRVEQGYLCSLPPYQAESEGVIVHFDPALIDLVDLLDIHVRTHASSVQHRMREKYRSAVYYFHDQQRQEVQRALRQIRCRTLTARVTQVLSLQGFRASGKQYQDYYLRNPQALFCQRHIAPKLHALARSHPQSLRSEWPVPVDAPRQSAKGTKL